MINIVPFEKFPQLETQRLILRELKLDDAEDVFAIYKDPAVMRYALDNAHLTITESRILVRFFAEEYRYRNLIWWGMVHKKERKVIGMLGLWNINARQETAELGFDTSSSYWRQGYTTEAIYQILDFGYHTLGLQMVYAKTVPENEPSAKLLAKVGFIEQGILPPHTPPNERSGPVRYFEHAKEES